MGFYWCLYFYPEVKHLYLLGMVQNLPIIHCFMLKMDDVNLKSEISFNDIIHSTHVLNIYSVPVSKPGKGVDKQMSL